MHSPLLVMAALAMGPFDHPYSCHGTSSAKIMGYGYTSSCIAPPDMPPHIAPRSSYHGNYYFRPYHHVHVVRQQAAAQQVGEDPRNPYANRFFLPFYTAAENRALSASAKFNY